MKLHLFFAVVAALLPGAASLPAQDESLAAIFTNAPRTAPAQAAGRRPCIIVIACHGLALSDLSCYGQTNFQTPNFDHFAAQGIRFTDYRAGSDDLAVAQAALLGAGGADPSTGRTTLARALKQSGYRTVLLGEWTADPQPWADGFDEFAGFLNEQEANNYYSDFLWRHSEKDPLSRAHVYENEGGRKARFLTDMFMDVAVNMSRMDLPDRANQFRPFFMAIGLAVPHSVAAGKDEYPVPTDAPYSGENWPAAAKNRAALVTRLDNALGSLFERLNQLGLTNNTAIFLAGAVAPAKFANRNLDFLTLPGDVRDGTAPEHLRVPMLVRWPGHVPAGQVSDAHWSAADFAPTALAIAAAKPVANFTGASILPVLLGETETNPPAGPDAGAPK